MTPDSDHETSTYIMNIRLDNVAEIEVDYVMLP